MRFIICLPTLLVSIAYSLVAAAAVASETDIDQLEALTPQALVAAAELQNHSLRVLAAAVEAAQLRVGQGDGRGPLRRLPSTGLCP